MERVSDNEEKNRGNKKNNKKKDGERKRFRCPVNLWSSLSDFMAESEQKLVEIPVRRRTGRVHVGPSVPPLSLGSGSRGDVQAFHSLAALLRTDTLKS